VLRRVQMVFGILVAVLASAVVLTLRPFLHKSDFVVAAVGLLVIVGLLFAGLLIRVQDLLPAGSSVAGEDQTFERSAIGNLVAVAVWAVPVIAVVAAVAGVSNRVWHAFMVREKGLGTPDADLAVAVLLQTPLWRRPGVMLQRTLSRLGRHASSRVQHSPDVRDWEELASPATRHSETDPAASAVAMAASPPLLRPIPEGGTGPGVAPEPSAHDDAGDAVVGVEPGLFRSVPVGTRSVSAAEDTVMVTMPLSPPLPGMLDTPLVVQDRQHLSR
jgi:hypothetical protein